MWDGGDLEEIKQVWPTIKTKALERKNMKIVAISVGSRGDIQPLIELGVEMIRRGHNYSVMGYEAFRPLCEEKNVPYIYMDGDARRLQKLLVADYKKSMDFMAGCYTLYKENPKFMDQVEEAIRGANLVLYGICSGLVRHVCDYLHIPCVRYFYSPFDRTDMYSMYTTKKNCRATGRSYAMLEPGMNLLTLVTGNAWRKKKGMKSWSLFDDYRKQNGTPILTLYPTTKVFMPNDPSWGNHINVTGYFFHPEEDAAGYTAPDGLEEFLSAGEKPIFVCFGKAEFEEMDKLQHMTYRVLKSMGIRAIVQGSFLEKEELPDTMYRIGTLPYSYIFPKVKGVIHHGGNTTVGIALWAGVPSLALPLALDQWFYGRAIAENGCGPEPLYWRKKLPTEAELTEAIKELVTADYSESLKRISEIVRVEDGCRNAANIIEKWNSF